MLNPSDLQKYTPDLPHCVRCAVLGIEECVPPEEGTEGGEFVMNGQSVFILSVSIRKWSHVEQVLTRDTVPLGKWERVGG